MQEVLGDCGNSLRNLNLMTLQDLMRYNGIGVVNLLCAGLLAYAYGRIRGKQDELQRERQLHE